MPEGHHRIDAGGTEGEGAQVEHVSVYHEVGHMGSRAPAYPSKAASDAAERHAFMSPYINERWERKHA
jgi:hypothetical protein